MEASLHLLGQPFIDFLGDRDFQASFQALGLLRLFQATGIRADICAAAIELTGKIQLDIAVGAAHHTDHFLLSLALPATHTLPLRDLLLHMGSLPCFQQITLRFRQPG